MKDEILHTALKQFLKLGIKQTSIQKLVDPLGISTKTFYKYYNDKEQLLEDCLKLYYSEQYRLFETLDYNANAASLLFNIWHLGIEAECRINKLFFEDLNYYYPALELRVEKNIVKKVWLKIKLILQKGIDDNTFKSDLNKEIFLESISVIYVAIARTGEFKTFRMPVNEIFINSIAILIRGICTIQSITDFDTYIKQVTPSLPLN